MLKSDDGVSHQQAQSNGADEVSVASSKNGPSKWTFHHWNRFLMSNIPMALIGSFFLIIHLVYFIVMCLIFVFVLKNPNLLNFCAVPIVVLLIVFLSQAVVYVFFVGAAAVFLRKVRDEFNISKELYVSMAVISLTFVGVGAVGLGQFWIKDATQRIAAILVIVGGLAVDASIYGLLPVINTFVWERRLRRARNQHKQQAAEHSSSFQDLDLALFIQEPSNFDCIEKYCKSELSVENLYAFREIQHYRQIASDDAKALLKAVFIYQTFVSEDAPLQLNIQRGQRVPIRNAVASRLNPGPLTVISTAAPTANPAAQCAQDETDQTQNNNNNNNQGQPGGGVVVDWVHLFDEIEKEILHTMSDTLMRFQTSSLFKKQQLQIKNTELV